MFIDVGLRFFGESFPGHPPQQELIDHYNRTMCELLDETRDFIILHYILTKRRDSDFWKTYANDVKVPDSLAEKLEMWKYKIPSATDFMNKVTTFIQANYSYILYGLHWQHEGLPGTIAAIDLERSQHILNFMKNHQKQVLAQAPLHIDNLMALRK
jgi:tryptophan halogenase